MFVVNRPGAPSTPSPSGSNTADRARRLQRLADRLDRCLVHQVPRSARRARLDAHLGLLEANLLQLRVAAAGLRITADRLPDALSSATGERSLVRQEMQPLLDAALAELNSMLDPGPAAAYANRAIRQTMTTLGQILRDDASPDARGEYPPGEPHRPDQARQWGDEPHSQVLATAEQPGEAFVG